MSGTLNYYLNPVGASIAVLDRERGQLQCLRPDVESAQRAAELLERQAAIKAMRVYAASRTKHAEMWKTLRADGLHIVSSWIDEAGPGQTASLPELWQRIAAEVRGSNAFVLYVEPDDFPLKGAFIEAGMALASSIPVVLVAPGCKFEPPSFRPIGSWIKHPLCRFAGTVIDGLFDLV